MMDIATPVSATATPATNHPRPASADQKFDWAMIVVALLVIALARSMFVVGNDQVAFSFAPSHVLPNVCLWRAFFHVECPGCGLTRSFIALAHGDVAASWMYHRLGWLMALLVVGQLPYRVYALRTGKHISRRLGAWIGWTLLGLLLLNWAAEMM